MKIGIDCRMWGPAHGGIGRYIQKLTEQLLLIDQKNSYTFFVHPNNPLPNLPDSCRIIHTPIHWYSLKEQLLLPSIIDNAQCDLIHFPHWNVPITLKTPYIVTIHDLILIHYPDRKASTHSAFMYALKYKGFRFILNHAIRDSAHILTVSNFSKQDIISNFTARSEKITVTPLGTDIQQNASSAPIHSKPYFLFVGSHYPHKNINFLMELFFQCVDSTLRDYDLILIGPRGPFTDETQKTINELNTKNAHLKSGRIILIPSTTDEELARWYSHASLFLFPSLYEGFGLPLLEAMASGTPIIASNTSSIPEVCGDAAVLLNPRDMMQWKTTIHSVINNAQLKNSLINHGKEQAKKFSWNSCAISTLQIYENVLK